MVETDQNALASALHATRGVICLVGAGGKKTTMYALAAAHPGRVALSSTSHMYVYDRSVVDQVVQSGSGPLAKDSRVVAFAGPTDTPQRVGGLDPEALWSIWNGGTFDLMLIKADGARARWIKAPAAYEPLIPAFADTVIPVLSIGVLGRRLDSGIAHRPELAAQVMGVGLDTPLTTGALARLLSSPAGALKNVGEARVVPLLNMVDDEALRQLGIETARAALAATDRFDTVVMAAMKRGALVQVVRRGD